MGRMIVGENRTEGATGSEERVIIQAVTPGTRADTVRYLFIVSRDQPDVYDRLMRDFAEDKEVEVLLDRRVGERRQRGQADAPGRRRSYRRRHPEGWTVPVSHLYRGDRPCLILTAQDPTRQPASRREGGSGFFGRE